VVGHLRGGYMYGLRTQLSKDLDLDAEHHTPSLLYLVKVRWFSSRVRSTTEAVLLAVVGFRAKAPG
jgi:hypothetical protein